jgi:hypothetical protein
MGIFGLQIDPFRWNRDPRYVFNDLARKTATKPKVGPAWLTIGGVTGSDIPRDPDSRIVLRFPHPEAVGQESQNEPPTMVFQTGVRAEWVGYHVDDSQWYVKKFDIFFMSQSHPHILNAVVLNMSDAKSPIRTRKVPRVTPAPKAVGGKPPRPPKNYVTRNSATFNIGGNRNNLVWWGDLSNAASRKLKAVFVGEVGDMTQEAGGPNLNLSNIGGSPVNYRGMSFFLFMEYSNRRWRVVGDGVFATRAGYFRNKRRSIFTVGAGSQKAWSSWPTHSRTWFDACDWSLYHSYGIEPLEDWRVASGQKQEQLMRWFGFKVRLTHIANAFPLVLYMSRTLKR